MVVDFYVCRTSSKKLKSLKKLVREENNNMEDYFFKNFYGQTFNQSTSSNFFKNRSNSQFNKTSNYSGEMMNQAPYPLDQPVGDVQN